MEDLIALLLEFLAGSTQTVGEMVLQMAVELFVDGIEHAFQNGVSAPTRPVLRVFLHGLLGAGLGWASTWVLPHLLVHGSVLPWINVLLSPALLGLALAAWGSRRVRRGASRSGIESFGTAFAFALAFGAVRLMILA